MTHSHFSERSDVQHGPLDGVLPKTEHPSSRSPNRLVDIAVIVVTFKSAHLAVESLRSLSAERTTPGLHLRAIVVDNASGDLPVIAEAVQRFDWSSWVTLVLAPRNGGFAYGNNLGIAQASSSKPPTYVYLLNPDTQVRPGAVGSLAHFLDTHLEVGIVGGGFEKRDGSDDSITFRFPNMISEIDRGLEFGLVSRLLKPWNTVRRMGQSDERVDWICGASMMIRPAVFSAIGGLDENYFLYFEETDFCWRARKAGFPTWYVSASRVMHIGGQSTAVTDLTGGLKRLPPYWFESRRRYFAVTFGVIFAMAIDLAAVVAQILGALKRLLQGPHRRAVPHYLRDLLKYSVLWPRNRDIPPARTKIATV
jgi:N-acetylglucosaminyl-diphospho-decaprenol L-rhamnosyltransferase